VTWAPAEKRADHDRDKVRKRAIRARMARTGEAYNATARPGDRERQADGPSS
jgi:hypothetical protein